MLNELQMKVLWDQWQASLKSCGLMSSSAQLWQSGRLKSLFTSWAFKSLNGKGC